jgi:hypothetical protein
VAAGAAASGGGSRHHAAAIAQKHNLQPQLYGLNELHALQTVKRLLTKVTAAPQPSCHRPLCWASKLCTHCQQVADSCQRCVLPLLPSLRLPRIPLISISMSHNM